MKCLLVSALGAPMLEHDQLPSDVAGMMAYLAGITPTDGSPLVRMDLNNVASPGRYTLAAKLTVAYIPTEDLSLGDEIVTLGGDALTLG